MNKVLERGFQEGYTAGRQDLERGRAFRNNLFVVGVDFRAGVGVDPFWGISHFG